MAFNLAPGSPGSGLSIDDLFRPMHLNFKFFGMEQLPTFACYDVMKNPDVEADLTKYRKHLESVFAFWH